MDLFIADCPQILQDRVASVMEQIPGEIILVQKKDTHPYKDTSIIVTKYKVYLQFGFEVAIYSTQVTSGIESGSHLAALDGEVNFTSVNLDEIESIILHAKFFKDFISRLLRDVPPNQDPAEGSETYRLTNAAE